MDARYTLKKNSDFRRLYTKGKKAVTPYFIVYCRKNREVETRIGYTVSAKLGHAVVRNRIRRRLREVCRLNRDFIAGGHDLILVARSRAEKADFPVLEAAFLNACTELGITAGAAK